MKKSIYISSDWYSEKQPICLAVGIEQNIYCLVDDFFSSLQKDEKEIQRNYQYKNKNIYIFYLDFSESTSVFKYLVKNDLIKTGSCTTHFYYSMKDLTLFLGEGEIQKYFQSSYPKTRNQSYIVQKRCIDGIIFEQYENEFRRIKLHDIYGWSNKKDLNEFNKLLNSSSSTKRKGSSLEKNLTLQSIRKTIDDNLCLQKLNHQMISFVNKIAFSIGLEKNFFNEETVPHGLGGVTAKFLQSFLEKEFENEGLIKDFLEVYEKSGVETSYKSTRKKISNIINGSGVSTILNKYSMNSGILNGLTQGGRTYNERWQEYSAEYVLDLDFVGCYSTALETLSYPIGIPICYNRKGNQKPITLKQFFKTYKKDLIPNLYIITISGDLSFSQTLLYSKLTTASQLQRVKSRIEANENVEEVTGDFALLEKQLKNTILTHDIWTVLEKICSANELGELLNMKVETALYYPKNKKVSKKKFLKKWQKINLERLYYNNQDKKTGKEIEVDNRPREWCSIPLKKLIKPLREKREQLKKLKNKKGLQEQYKLILNSIYGVLASPYFEVGNVVLSNNITAKARVQVWMASRVLNGIQCITDGFQYQPMNIYKIHLNKEKNPVLPGLSTLSNLQTLGKHKQIKKGTLGEKSTSEWIEYFKNPNKDWKIDMLTKDNINEFWSHYDLKLGYEIAHKMEHTSKNMFYIKKAHYSLQLIDNEIIHKYRGITPQLGQTPQYYEIAESILKKRECEIKTLDYTIIKDAKISDYLEQKTKGIIKLPGEKIEKKTTFSLTNEDYPSINEKHHNNKKRYKKDYAENLLTSIPLKIILENRYEDYITKRKNYEKNYKKNNKKNNKKSGKCPPPKSKKGGGH